jgi:hypothetical protein
VLEEAGFRFGFFSADRLNEPPHIHAIGSGGSAKVWLSPVALAWARGLTAAEIRTVLAIVRREADGMLAAWRRYGEG